MYASANSARIKGARRLTKRALRERYYQHQIAAFFGINQGRISEFKNSAAYQAVMPVEELPRGFPNPQ